MWVHFQGRLNIKFVLLNLYDCHPTYMFRNGQIVTLFGVKKQA